MKTVDTSKQFIRTTDGATLLRQANGAYFPVASETNHKSLANITDDQIEQWSKTDPDQLGLDDAFWDHVDLETPTKEAISIKLDSDVLKWFRRDGKGYQTRINSVLRHFVENVKKAG